MNQVPVLSASAPWPNREVPASFVQRGREPISESALFEKYDATLAARLEEKIAIAKEQLNVYAKRAENRKNEEALDAQLRQNELNDIERFSKSLAKLNSVRPASLPTPISKARVQLMESVKDFAQANGDSRVVVTFPLEALDVCQTDMVEINDFTTGNGSLLYCQRLFGMNFGKRVCDVVNHARRMQGRPMSIVRNGELR